MVYTPAFSSLRAKEAAAPTAIEDSKGKLWFWGCLIVSATLATVVYIPVVYWGSSTSASQTETMGSRPLECTLRYIQYFDNGDILLCLWQEKWFQPD